MPWWSWIVIWVGLVLALLGMFAWLIYRIVKKLLAALHALSELGDRTELLESRITEFAEEPFRSAVLASAGELSVARDQARGDRENSRQIHNENRMARGRVLLNADPQQFSQIFKRT